MRQYSPLEVSTHNALGRQQGVCCINDGADDRCAAQAVQIGHHHAALDTLFGSGVVDLRYADFTSPEVEIYTYSITGGQTI